MYTNGSQSPLAAKAPNPISQTTNPTNSESEILMELEQKRRQLDNEIATFQAKKEKEFREFEQDLRQSSLGKTNATSTDFGRNGFQEGLNKPPSRTSSSSALNLLAGRGVSKKPQISVPSKKRISEALPQKTTSLKAGSSASQPVVSLDKLNIKGENALPQPGRPRTPPTPTLLSKTLTRSSSSSSIVGSPPRPKGQFPRLPVSRSSSQTSPDDDKHRNPFTGVFTPSYISLVESKPAASYQSSALETPLAGEEAVTAPSSYESKTVNEVLPLSSSSFPPHVTLSPGNHSHTSKRAYTAPTVSSNRKPSALRTVSGGTMSRKPKHVTFRLADSAIVEPSSSYEEGPSPQFEEENHQRSGSGSRSPLRISKTSQLHRTLSPDEEDEEAGVKPGMGMGDVIQRLNEYTVSEAAKHGESLVLDVEEDEEDEEDDEDDVPMELSGHRHEDNSEDASDSNYTVDYHEHDEEELPKIEEDGYFSPKAKHISTMSAIPRDKDRLLFESRRHSDDSDDMRPRTNNKIASPTFDESGFAGGLRQSSDGGSGVGFFELDEELASPDAGQVRPFQFDTEPDVDVEDTDANGPDGDNALQVNGLGLLTTTRRKEAIEEKNKRWSGESASKFGVGSVPIDIIRPSLSVSSSWVGTFGH